MLTIYMWEVGTKAQDIVVKLLTNRTIFGNMFYRAKHVGIHSGKVYTGCTIYSSGKGNENVSGIKKRR